MGLIFRLEESDFAGYLDDGVQCLAQVNDVKLQEKSFKDQVTGEVVKKVVFKFVLITDDDHDGSYLWGETSTKFNTDPRCRLKAWAEAILGRVLPPQFELDTDTLLDKKCRVIVGRKEYTDKEGVAQTRNYVMNVNPTREAAASLAASLEEPF